MSRGREESGEGAVLDRDRPGLRRHASLAPPTDCLRRSTPCPHDSPSPNFGKASRTKLCLVSFEHHQLAVALLPPTLLVPSQLRGVNPPTKAGAMARPPHKTVAELAEMANKHLADTWDPDQPLYRWLRAIKHLANE